MNRDQAVGEIVARMRLDKTLSQAALAESMRSRNPEHRWSQATVWKLEKGERPLKASEVKDLSVVLDLNPLVLIDPSDANDAEARLWQLIEMFDRHARQLDEDLDRLNSARKMLHVTLIKYEKASATGGEEWEPVRKLLPRIKQMLERESTLRHAIKDVLADRGVDKIWRMFRG